MNDHDDTKRSENTGENGQREIKSVDYLREVRSHIRNGNNKDAYNLILQATVRYPEDPLILSYYGCLQALVDKKFRNGVETCKRAIVLLEKRGSSTEKAYFPVFYHNLGKAYIAAGRNQDAFDALRKGLKYDSGNSDLKKELQVLGVRKAPPLKFLDRSNPINVLLGMVFKTSKKAPPGKKSGGRSSSR